VSWQTTIKQYWKGGCIGILLTTALGLVLLLADTRLGETLIHLSYDLPFRYREPIETSEVVLVYLDDDSYRELDQPYSSPWDRGLYARLLERLTAEGARGVGFDIVFSDANQRHPEGDEHFARAIKASGRVILGADYSRVAEGGWSFFRALKDFSDAAAGWGMVQVLPDQDFVVRRHFHVPPNQDDEPYSSLSWELARIGGAEATRDPKERFRERWVNYYGPPGLIPNISFRLTLNTNGFCPAGFFSNKLVLIGGSLKTLAANERKDELRTPYTRMSFCPAVDVHAAQLLNLLRKDWLTRSSTTAEIFLILLAGVGFGFGLQLFRPLPAVGVAVVSAILIAVAAEWIFSRFRVWFPSMVLVAAQIPVAALWSVVFSSVQLYVENRLYRHSLQMYLSPKLVKKFSSNRDLLKVGARKQVLTVLFSDIANFTSISEGMDSDELARAMNSYFTSAVSHCIHATDGTVVKYIGDAIFAFWNAPDAQEDHALRACQAALKFQDQEGVSINGHHVVTRIGLHTGVANVGNFGSPERVDYTALGEDINLASRMEALNKHLGTQILMTGETRDAINAELVTRFLGRFRLKGFARTVKVYELAGGPDQAPALRPLVEAFDQALVSFRQRKWQESERAFARVLALKKEDGPSNFYLSLIAEFKQQPPSETWGGEIELKEK
jgi:adenylate cyclase